MIRNNVGAQMGIAMVVTTIIIVLLTRFVHIDKREVAAFSYKCIDFTTKDTCLYVTSCDKIVKCGDVVTRNGHIYRIINDHPDTVISYK